MASITERNRSGKITFLAQITKRSHGFTEARSFGTRKTAEAWAKKREAEIDALIAQGVSPKTKAKATRTLGDAIAKYVETAQADIGKTKAQVLRTIQNEYDIAQMQCDKITSVDIVRFAEQIAARPASPSTVGNYISHVGAVFRHAPALWGFALDKNEFDKAYISVKHHGIISKSNQRSRIPTLDELDLLLTHFEISSLQDRRILPMHVITVFALFSTRRLSEIIRIRWEHLNTTKKQILVSGMKNPGRKGGIDTVCMLPDPCLAILETLPKKDERIFPYSDDVISRRFTDTCKMVGVKDLHFHDLRHAGATRLAEMGFEIPQITAVTGHRGWQNAQRYTHVDSIGDKYKDWSWIDRIITRQI